MPPWVTQHEVAVAIGVSDQAVNQAWKDGRIPRREDGKYDLAVVQERWRRTSGGTGAANGSRRRATGNGNGSHDAGAGEGQGGPDYYIARAVRERYQAMLAKLEYEERTGKLVSAEEVRAKAFAAGRRLRDRLQTMADRVATLTAATSDRAKCHRIVMAEVNRALDELAEDQGAG
jgi:hypothetical protein